MSKDNFDPQAQFDRLMQATNMADKAHFAEEPDTVAKVQILPDKTIAPALFIPHPFLVDTYKAHPTTIRAMRKDLFVGGNDEFIDLEYNYLCECKNVVDLQFWNFCPHCEKAFPKDLPPPLTP